MNNKLIHISNNNLTCLDHNATKCNTGCGAFSVKGEIGESGLWGVGRANCKRWICPSCGPKKSFQLKKAIISKAEEKGLQRLLTLTLDPSKIEGDSLAYINKCWTKLRVYLSREYGKSISFIRIAELQKNGNAHFHILIDRFIPFEWIKKAWQAVGGGGVHIQFVDIHRVTHYLGKYLTKDIFLDLPRGKRRYSTSKGITLSAKKDPSGWQFLKYPIEYLYVRAGKAVTGEPKRDKDGRLTFFKILIPDL